MHVLSGILCHYELISTSLSALQCTLLFFFLCETWYYPPFGAHDDDGNLLPLSSFFCRYNLVIIQSESLLTLALCKSCFKLCK